MYNKPISTDFTGVDDFSIPPEGKTLVKVLDVYPYVSKKGKDTVVFEIETPDGYKLKHYCFNDVDDNGKTNRWMLKKTIEAITGEKQAAGPASLHPRDIVNKEFYVIIKHEDFTGTSGKTWKTAKVLDVVVDEVVLGQPSLPPGEKGNESDLPF